jgi:membrane associated rhomboid family serine protease
VAATTEMPTCYRHPDRPTGLSCSECGRPICTDCMTPAAVGLRCPEHSGKPQGVARVTTGATRAVTGVGASRVNLVTTVLIAINVGVYLLEIATGGSASTGTGNWLYAHGALVVNGVTNGKDIVPIPAHSTAQGLQLVGLAHGEWWRLLASAFLHYGPFHLAINMYSLFFAGSLLEQLIGRWRFALLYVVAGIAGGAGAALVSPNVVTVGASGAIFGILGGLFVLERRGNIATGGQIAGLIVINLIFTFALASHISVGGHVGGLIAGFILMLVLVQFRRSTALSVASSLAVAVAAVVIAYVRARGYT